MTELHYDSRQIMIDNIQHSSNNRQYNTDNNSGHPVTNRPTGNSNRQVDHKQLKYGRHSEYNRQPSRQLDFTGQDQTNHDSRISKHHLHANNHKQRSNNRHSSMLTDDRAQRFRSVDNIAVESMLGTGYGEGFQIDDSHTTSSNRRNRRQSSFHGKIRRSFSTFLKKCKNRFSTGGQSGRHVDTTSQEESDSFIFSPGGTENEYSCIQDDWDTMIFHQTVEDVDTFFQNDENDNSSVIDDQTFGDMFRVNGDSANNHRKQVDSDTNDPVQVILEEALFLKGLKKEILALEGEVRTVMERIEVKFKLLDSEELYLGLRDQVAQIISDTNNQTTASTASLASAVLFHVGTDPNLSYNSRYEPSVHSQDKSNYGTRLESPGADLNMEEEHLTRLTSSIPSTHSKNKEENGIQVSKVEPVIKDLDPKTELKEKGFLLFGSRTCGTRNTIRTNPWVKKSGVNNSIKSFDYIRTRVITEL